MTDRCFIGLQEEAWIGGSLQHPNIVQQLGVIETRWKGVRCIGALVQEWMQGGSLLSCMRYALPSIPARTALSSSKSTVKCMRKHRPA